MWQIASVDGSAKIEDTVVKIKSSDGMVTATRDFSQTIIPHLTRGTEPNLEGYWRFDEGSGSVAKDSSGNGYDGTISGAVWSPNARQGKSLLFDGNDKVTVPSSASGLSITGPVSVEIWVYPTASGSNMWFLHGKGQYVIWVQSNGKVRFADTHGHFVDSDPGVLKLNSWNHVCGVFSGKSGDPVNKDTAFLYVNGVSVGKYYGGTWSPSTFNGIEMGSAFKGNLDEARVYSRALTPQEVSLHSQIGENIIIVDNNADGYINEGDVLMVDENSAHPGDYVEIYVGDLFAGKVQISS